MDKITLEKLFISSTDTFQVAVEKLNLSGKGIVLVVNEERHLLGTITDGDIRRAILAGTKMETPIKEILGRKSSSIYPHPITANRTASNNDLIALMKKWVLRHIPLLDKKGQVIDLVTMDDLLPARKPDLHAVVMAGGETTRLHPLIPDLPKPMLPVGNRPLMEFTINQLHEAGFDHVSLQPITSLILSSIILGMDGNLGSAFLILMSRSLSVQQGSYQRCKLPTHPCL
jgi:CBS domain-containing protein